VGKTKHGHASEQHTENPKYYWYRFITKERVEVNREGLHNQFATNPKNMYETIGITSINHKIESSDFVVFETLILLFFFYLLCESTTVLSVRVMMMIYPFIYVWK